MDFRPAAETVSQDGASLARYLARFGVELGPAEPRQFAGGFGNLDYFDLGGRWAGGSAATRRRDRCRPGANDMVREYRILSSLLPAYPLAPRVLLYCTEAGVLGVQNS